jgi:hypothetical protein
MIYYGFGTFYDSICNAKRGLANFDAKIYTRHGRQAKENMLPPFEEMRLGVIE